MSRPYGFSWIDRPRLAALARPYESSDLAWLREAGIELLLSLTEDPLDRHWVADAGLLALHVPVADMSPPTIDQIRTCISAIERAHARGMGVAVHCAAGLGRTGTVLACYLVSRGMGAAEAIGRMRELRPGSVETSEQEEVVFEFARSRAAS